MNRRPVKAISLVLGSGGARGLAHIGVIDALLREGLEIRSITGCSMGALVGGIHAMGKLDEYRDWACALERMDVLRLLDFAFGRNGLIKGDRIIGVLRDLIGEADIEDLPIQFTAVATDLDRQKEVWITEGPLFDAVRASIAIPTVFTPYRLRGRRLVDGGLLNPVPITPTLRDDTDATIAVNLAGTPDPALEQESEDNGGDNESGGNGTSERNGGARHRLHASITAFIDGLSERFGSDDGDDRSDDLGLPDIISRSFDTMQNTLTRMKLAASMPDLVIDIPRNACQTYEYYRARRVIEIGDRMATRALESFLDGRR